MTAQLTCLIRTPDERDELTGSRIEGFPLRGVRHSVGAGVVDAVVAEVDVFERQ